MSEGETPMAARRDPDPDSQVAPDAPAGDEKPADTVTLAVGHPYDELVLHDLEDDKGKPLVITRAGTEIPADHEKAVRDAARAADVPIRKVN